MPSQNDRELNRRVGVLAEAAHLLGVRAAMIEALARRRHVADVITGRGGERIEISLERADRLRRVAAWLASVRLSEFIKDDPDLAEMLLGPPGPSVVGTDFMEPRLPRHHTTWREPEDRIRD
jgi:hypothetical protein